MREKRTFRLGRARGVVFASVLLALVFPLSGCQNQSQPFAVEETSIASVHAAYESGQLTSRQLAQLYLDRIEAYDKNGPKINSIITVNPTALEEADRLDAAFGTSGLVGPLHGIPVLVKDMIDAEGMPTTMGSILFKDYYPDKDALVVEKLKRAGAIILAKVTLAEFARGDTYGSLYGETRNPYDLERTVGGSSGGSAASVSANFGTVAVGQEGFASIRRPSAWNSIVGMRATTGLVAGGLGPMTRTVEDVATLLDVLVGYDPADSQSAFGVGEVPPAATHNFSTGTACKERASACFVSPWVLIRSLTQTIFGKSPKCSTGQLENCKLRERRWLTQLLFRTSRNPWRPERTDAVVAAGVVVASEGTTAPTPLLRSHPGRKWSSRRIIRRSFRGSGSALRRRNRITTSFYWRDKI